MVWCCHLCADIAIAIAVCTATASRLRRSPRGPVAGGCRWEEGHIEEWSQISFPDGIVEWAEREFRRVKEKQARLLGTSSIEMEYAERAQTAIRSKL